MTTTRPIEKSGAKIKRFHLLVLSGGARGQRHLPDDAGRLRVGRAGADLPAATKGWANLPDESVSRFHLELSANELAVVLRDRSLNGTTLGPLRLRDGAVDLLATSDLRVGDTDLRLVIEPRDQTVPVAIAPSLGPLLGGGAAMQRVFAQAEGYFGNDLPLLLGGETGTGKSELARVIHERGRRRAKPFAVVDCASLTGEVLTSELFGYVKGAFTGANGDREGVFERSAGGTVLLDEVGDLPPAGQAKLLTVLERKVVQRVGELGVDRKVDVRIISATHRDLAAMVNAGTFRRDLYMRLAVGGIEMPPLRTRRDDLPALADALLQRARLEEKLPAAGDAGLPEAVLREIQSREWVGNVRELYQHMRYYAAADTLPPELSRAPGQPGARGALAVDDLLDHQYEDAHSEVLRRFDRLYLPRYLRRFAGKIGKAADRLGIHRVTLSRRLEECGVRKDLSFEADE